MPSSTSSSRANHRPPWGLVWALALLLVCELLVRWGYDPQHIDPDLFGANYPDHRYAFSRARPRCWRSPARIDCYGDEYQPIAHQTLQDPKPEHGLRIIVVGTSPSYGGLAYPTALAEPLSSRLERDVEVLNLSVRGHGTTRMVEQLDEALTLDPDIIVLHPHGSNEFEDERDAAYVGELYEGVPGLIRHSEFANVAQKLAASQVYTRARGLVDLRGSPLGTAGTEGAAGKDAQTVARWHATIESNTNLMIARSRAAGLVVVVVGRAQQPKSEDSAWLEYMDGFLRPLASEDGVYYLDSMAVLDGAFTDIDDAFVNSTHFSASGHRAIAKALNRARCRGRELVSEPHQPHVVGRPRRVEVLLLGVLLIALALLRLDKIDLDAPENVVRGYSGQAHFRDEVAKAHEARNKALWDQWSLSEHDDYGFWRAQSPSWVWGEYYWFRAFGVGLLQARLFVIVQTIIALGLLAWLVLVRHGFPAAVAAVGLLGLNWAYLIYSRLALMEGALICWLLVVTAMLSQVERHPTRAGLWSMLATMAMLVACTIKQTGLLLVPAFSLTLIALGLRAAGSVAGLNDGAAPWTARLRTRLCLPQARLALVAVTTLALALALLVFNPDYQERLAFNAAHFTEAREESVWVRAGTTLIRGLFGIRLQLMFVRLAPIMLWLATLELVRISIGLIRAGRARKRGESPPNARSGALSEPADWIDGWMLAWAIFALLANLASPHRAIRFQLVLLPPVAWLAGAVVGRIWRQGWSKSGLRAWARGCLVALAGLGTLSTGLRYANWTQSSDASAAKIGEQLVALIGERDAVVIGEFAAQAVFETHYRHFYVRPDQFNFSPETLRALQITHIVVEDPRHDRVLRTPRGRGPRATRGSSQARDRYVPRTHTRGLGARKPQHSSGYVDDFGLHPTRITVARRAIKLVNEIGVAVLDDTEVVVAPDLVGALGDEYGGDLPRPDHFPLIVRDDHAVEEHVSGTSRTDRLDVVVDVVKGGHEHVAIEELGSRDHLHHGR